MNHQHTFGGFPLPLPRPCEAVIIRSERERETQTLHTSRAETRKPKTRFLCFDPRAKTTTKNFAIALLFWRYPPPDISHLDGCLPWTGVPFTFPKQDSLHAGPMSHDVHQLCCSVGVSIEEPALTNEFEVEELRLQRFEHFNFGVHQLFFTQAALHALQSQRLPRIFIRIQI